MWTNPRTGKGWSDAEEMAFDQIMKAGRLDRMQAIRLFRRFNGNLIKALSHARQTDVGQQNFDGLARARESKRLKASPTDGKAHRTRTPRPARAKAMGSLELFDSVVASREK